MGRETGGDCQSAFYHALGFDVGCSEGVAVLVTVN